MQTSTIYAPPYMTEKTAVVAVAGTTPRRAAPHLDGFFLTDLLLWFRLVRARTTSLLSFFTAVNIETALTENGLYVFGNPGFENSRKVISLKSYAEETLKTPYKLYDNESLTLDSDNLAGHFLDALKEAARYKEPLVDKVVILIFAHGAESRPVEFLLGNKLVSLAEIYDIMSNSDLEVELVMTSFVSGGWSYLPLNQNRSIGWNIFDEALDQRWLACTYDPKQEIGSTHRRNDFIHIVDDLLRQEFSLTDYDVLQECSLAVSDIEGRLGLNCCDYHCEGVETDVAVPNDTATKELFYGIRHLLQNIDLKISRDYEETRDRLIDFSKRRLRTSAISHGECLQAFEDAYSSLPKASFPDAGAWLEPCNDDAKELGPSEIWVRLSHQGKPVPVEVANQALQVLKCLAWQFYGHVPSIKTVRNQALRSVPKASWAERLAQSTNVSLLGHLGDSSHAQHMCQTLQIFENRSRLAHFANLNTIRIEAGFHDLCDKLDVSNEQHLMRHSEIFACFDLFKTSFKSQDTAIKPFFHNLCRYLDNQTMRTVFENYLVRTLEYHTRTMENWESRYLPGEIDYDNLSDETVAEFHDKPKECYLRRHGLMRIARKSPVWEQLQGMFSKCIEKEMKRKENGELWDMKSHERAMRWLMPHRAYEDESAPGANEAGHTGDTDSNASNINDGHVYPSIEDEMPTGHRHLSTVPGNQGLELSIVPAASGQQGSSALGESEPFGFVEVEGEE